MRQVRPSIAAAAAHFSCHASSLSLEIRGWQRVAMMARYVFVTAQTPSCLVCGELTHGALRPQPGAGRGPCCFFPAWAQGTRKLWGLRPQTPVKIKNKKDSYPSPLSAFREQRGGKGKRKAWGLFAPKPPTRNNVPGPDQLAHRTPDTTQPGQVQILSDFG